MDRHGWLDIKNLVVACRATAPVLAPLTDTDIEELASSPEGERFELKAGQIRARYGHTIRLTLDYDSSVPPSLLYHGTTFENAMSIRLTGLVPMRRHYVHLSSDIPYATTLQRKNGRRGVLLAVHARDAHDAGIPFWRASPIVWLAEAIHVRHIALAVANPPTATLVLVPLSTPAQPSPQREAMLTTIQEFFDPRGSPKTGQRGTSENRPTELSAGH
jgi:putative RNA 2'-phosphotransferase